MPVTGYASTLKVGGTATAFTNEPTTELAATTPNTKYRITDATKRAVDPAVAVVVEVDADGGGGGGYAVVPSTDYVFNYATGTVVFDANQGDDALVRVSGSYRPLYTVAQAKGLTMTFSRDILDKSNFEDSSNGARSKLAGLKELAAQIESLDDTNTDLDSGLTTRKLFEDLNDGTPIVLEFKPGGGDAYRAWMVLESDEVKASADALVEAGLNLMNYPVDNASGGQTFGWE